MEQLLMSNNNHWWMRNPPEPLHLTEQEASILRQDIAVFLRGMKQICNNVNINFRDNEVNSGYSPISHKSLIKSWTKSYIENINKSNYYIIFSPYKIDKIIDWIRNW